MFDVFEVYRRPLSANVVHAQHDADVAYSGFSASSLKMVSVFFKEGKICYQTAYYTLCLDSVNREKLRWKVRI